MMRSERPSNFQMPRRTKSPSRASITPPSPSVSTAPAGLTTPDGGASAGAASPSFAGSGSVVGSGTVESPGEKTHRPTRSALRRACASDAAVAAGTFGTAWGAYPDTGAVPLVIDATSDVMTRSVPWSRVACLYAGAQKNIGPSGVTLVIVRKDFLEAGRTDIPSIFRYRSFADAQSLYNTPPTFSIYLLRGTLRWIEQQGGVAWLEAESLRKSGAVYAVCDADPDFFRAPVEKESRSRTNVVFRLPTPELEKRFLSEATKAGLVGLKGHRSTGGIRASIYAAVSMASVQALVDFMAAFRKTA